MSDSDNDVIDSAKAVSDAVRDVAARLGLQQQRASRPPKLALPPKPAISASWHRKQTVEKWDSDSDSDESDVSRTRRT